MSFSLKRDVGGPSQKKGRELPRDRRPLSPTAPMSAQPRLLLSPPVPELLLPLEGLEACRLPNQEQGVPGAVAALGGVLRHG